jgi:hypothetical protein
MDARPIEQHNEGEKPSNHKGSSYCCRMWPWALLLLACGSIFVIMVALPVLMHSCSSFQPEWTYEDVSCFLLREKVIDNADRRPNGIFVYLRGDKQSMTVEDRIDKMVFVEKSTSPMQAHSSAALLGDGGFAWHCFVFSGDHALIESIRDALVSLD